MTVSSFSAGQKWGPGYFSHSKRSNLQSVFVFIEQYFQFFRAVKMWDCYIFVKEYVIFPNETVIHVICYRIL